MSPRRLFVAAGLALLAALFARPGDGGRDAAAQGELIAYRQVAQWPERAAAAQGLFQTPSDLDVARDGHVFVADPGIGGVHVLSPSGSFEAPFGVTGGLPAQLGQVGPIAVGPDPTAPGFPFGAERVYVVDPATERVVFFTLGGSYQGEWRGIQAQGIAAAADGMVYLLDRETTQVRAYDAVAGTQSWVWGTRGSEDGQFTSFTDLSVSADGKVLAIGDKRGQRVQLFDVSARAEVDAGGPPLRPRRAYDLRDARFTQNNQTCDGSRVNAMGGDQVFLGMGAGACIVDARSATFAIAASAKSNTICRATVDLPRLRMDTQAYVALAESDPNPGKCGDKRGTQDPTPVVVKYNDTALRQVGTVIEAASNEDSANPVLFSPEALSMADPDTVFVADSSSKFRFFDRAGRQLASAARDSQTGDFNGDFQFFRIQTAVAAELPGEVFGYYFNLKRGGADFTVNAGVGRFKTVEKRDQNGVQDVIEPIWTDQLASSFQQVEIPAIAFNPVTRELLALRSETVAQQRSTDVRIARYTPDGRRLSPSWDLPDDRESNPYADMVVGPDGLVYVLDDLADVVRVLAPDGTPLREVPVAFDARAVAAGPASPDGAIFVLREPGSIERYADDGRVTARLDGRPLPFSDPTTLTDLVVDGDGRVYVADGQASLITVLEATANPDEIPIPDDGQCLYRGQAAADPARLNLGEATTVTLALAGRCGPDEEPTDIVVVVPYYRRLQQGADPSATTITDMLRLGARVNFQRHRMGIVSYYGTVTTELPLSADRAAYMAKAKDVTRSDPPNQQVKPRLKDAMEKGAKLFTDPARRRVMLLLRADYCDPAFERFPGQCSGYPPAEATALALRQSGVTIVAAVSFSAFQLASSDEDALFTIDGAHRRMVRYRQPAALATGLTTTHRVPANVAVEPGGISGGGVWQAPDVIWSVPSVGTDGWRATLRLAPGAGGTWPVAERAEARFTDGWGSARVVAFPVPQVEVIGPTPTVPAPTATPLPATATPRPPTVAPTATARPPVPAFLPIAFAQRCETLPQSLEIALVLDTSSSMAAPTAPGGEPKLAAAKAAAAAFVDALRPQDRAAVVAFDGAARLVMGLSADHAAARQAVEGLGTGQGTRLDLGLAVGGQALAAGRPGAAPVLVLLTDGRPSVTAEAVLAAAEAARAAGVEIYAIGLGADVDGTLLAAVAGDARRYFEAPRTGDLRAVFEALLGRTRVVCP